MVTVGKHLSGAQGLQFSQGKIAYEEVGDLEALELYRALAIGEFRVFQDIGGIRQHRIVTDDQHAILG